MPTLLHDGHCPVLFRAEGQAQPVKKASRTRGIVRRPSSTAPFSSTTSVLCECVTLCVRFCSIDWAVLQLARQRTNSFPQPRRHTSIKRFAESCVSAVAVLAPKRQP